MTLKGSDETKHRGKPPDVLSVKFSMTPSCRLLIVFKRNVGGKSGYVVGSETYLYVRQIVSNTLLLYRKFIMYNINYESVQLLVFQEIYIFLRAQVNE